MRTWILAKKDLRLLLRDRRAVIILIAMPLIFIVVLGLSLGEGFGQKPDDRLRVSVVDQDEGWAEAPPPSTPGAAAPRRWSTLVERDLSGTAGLRVELLQNRQEAERLVRSGKRAAVLVFAPDFSRQVGRCSFLPDGINPFYRNGVKLSEIHVEVLRDPAQQTASSIIEQVAQVTMLRVVLPWMIGRAFEKLSDPKFLNLLGEKIPALRLLPDPVKQSLGAGIQDSLQDLFPRYKLIGKTWAALTKSDATPEANARLVPYTDEGAGLLKRGALRYQILVPAYTVMFAFFLVLTVGWLFVAERHQGTLKRLRAAPLSKTELLLGKLLPCFGLSLAQGFFLLVAGKAFFGMSWGADPLWLVPVVVCTSLAAMGLALLVAALAHTETQVAIYGTLLVLVLAGLSGCLMGDRELMPEVMQRISLFTPHAWALVAYKQLLTVPVPDVTQVAEACATLAAFGVGFIGLAWWFLKLD